MERLRAAPSHAVVLPAQASRRVKCPRCGALLLEFQPNQHYARYFRCPECWVDYSLFEGALLQGKKERATTYNQSECRAQGGH